MNNRPLGARSYKPERSKRWLSRLALLVIMCSASNPAGGHACQPSFHFLFRSEARIAVDTLSDTVTTNGVLTRMVLMHNLGFHKDKSMREKAEKLLKKRFPAKDRTPLLNAYAGSLQMIKVGHRTMGSKVLRTANPLVKSPYKEARDGFRIISEAGEKDSANTIIRVLRATASAESAEHLPELFEVAAEDLAWLESTVIDVDSVMHFFINLNWAKYHYKRAKTQSTEGAIELARERVERAKDYACTPVYAGWAAEWEKRIFDLSNE